jgi:hypothetical protein
MLSLALDGAFLGSAHLIDSSSVILTNMSSEAFGIGKISYAKPRRHNAARLVHGLD